MILLFFERQQYPEGAAASLRCNAGHRMYILGRFRPPCNLCGSRVRNSEGIGCYICRYALCKDCQDRLIVSFF